MLGGFRYHFALLLAVRSAAVDLQFQRAGAQAAAQRWATWSSIPGVGPYAGGFLALGAFNESPKSRHSSPFHMLDFGRGLGLFVCQKGDGRTFPKAGDVLTMHYVGKLTKDDSEFDSSRARGRPFKFTIGEGRVIKGWEEGVMRMSLGERGILQVPAAKGYGARGAGGKIPPNADLYFDVELLAINGKPAPEKLPEQGYSGEKVAHEDMKTCTDDWQKEYGHEAGKEKKAQPKPEPEPAPQKSGSMSQSAMSLAVLAAALCVFSASA